MTRSLHVMMMAVLTAGVLSAPLLLHAVEVRDLRCEYQEKPLGIDAVKPRLSWKLETGNLDASTRGIRQVAYQVLVASMPELLAKDKGDVWDSGKVKSSQQNGIFVPVALAHKTGYCWKAMIWDQNDKPADWSPVARFETGFFDLSQWKAGWLNASEFAVHLARKEFYVDPEKVVKKARIYLASTGAGVNSCVLRLNGKRVGDDIYFPGPCEQFKAMYSVYDVAGLLNKGTNVIGLLYDKRASVIMEATYADGTVVTIATDNTWKGLLKGPYQVISGLMPYGGGQLQVYDSRLEKSGWDQPGYDDRGWGVLDAETADFGISLQTKSSWIWTAKASDQEVYFRKTIIADNAGKGSMLISADDGYELYINGKLAGSGDNWQTLKKYAVELKQGKNVISVKARNHFGPGGFLAEIYCGDRIITTGADWKTSSVKTADWCNVDFDDATWTHATVIAAFGKGPWGTLSPTPITKLKARYVPCKIIEELKPVEILAKSNGVYIVDFGQEVAGHVRLSAAGGKSGQLIRVRYSEEYDKTSKELDQRSVYRDAHHDYILKDDKAVVIEPEFFNVGYRYVEVSGYPGELTADKITSLAVASDVVSGSSFQCSDALLNRLHKMAVWSFLGNLQNIPMDCPGRERRGWTADTHCVSGAESINFDMQNFYDKWLDDHQDCQQTNGWIPVELPLSSDSNRDIKWPASCIFIPWDTYQAYGDKAILSRYYPMMQKYLAFIRSLAHEDCSSVPWGGYGDWLAKKPASADYLAFAYYYRCADLLTKIAGELGKENDRNEYAALAAFVRRVIQTKYRHNGERVSYDNNTQSANAHALAFGISDKADSMDLFKNIIDDYRAEGRNTAGFLGIRWVLPVLAAAGKNEEAYSYIRNPKEGGWAYFIQCSDATTLHEDWQFRPGSSHNHAFLGGSLDEWFYQELAGISSVRPGYEVIRIRPYVPSDISWVKAQIVTVRGTVKSEWRKGGDGKLAFDIVIPPNTTATVYVPSKDAASVTESGKAIDKTEGVKFLRMESGAAVFEVTSGAYQFQSNVSSLDAQ